MTYIARLAVALPVAGVLLLFRRVYGRPYLGLWGLSFLALAAYVAGCAVAVSGGPTISGGLLRTGGSLVGQIGAYWQGAFLGFGTWAVLRERPPDRPAVWLTLVGLATVAVAATLLVIPPDSATRHLRVGLSLRAIVTGPAALVSGVVLLRRTGAGPLGQRVAGTALTLYGVWLLWQLVPGLLMGSIWNWEELGPYFGFVDLVLEVAVGLGMVIWLLEEERSRATRLSQRLREAHKMEALGRLVGGIAHDFNNVLTVVLGHAQLLREKAGEGSDEATSLEEIDDAGRRARDMIQQLLAFSREQVVRARPLDLNAVVEETADFMGRLLGEDIELVVETDPRRPRLRADRAQLEQVISNLVLNARDAMPQGGTIILATANGRLPSGGPASVLEVKDTGAGIPEEIRGRIFEPYFTTKPHTGETGLGLGLATVQGIVSQSGGAIEIDSGPDRGTVFRLFFPAMRGGDRSDGPRRTDIPRGTAVLVGTDDRFQEESKTSLSGAGFDVVEVGSGTGAMERLRELGPEVELVLADVALPDFGGPELVDRMRSEGLRTPVLLLSRYARAREDDRTAIRAGVALLPKPFTEEELLEAIGRIVAARSGG